MVLAISVFVQVEGTSGLVVAPGAKSTADTTSITLPSYVDIRRDASDTVVDAKSTTTGRGGVAWDSCAGMCLFNSRELFVSWDSDPVKYRINGTSSHDFTQGTGQVLVGLPDDVLQGAGERRVDWYLVDGAYVPGLSETLISAVWFSVHRGVYTIIDAEPYLLSRGGARIPLDISRNVTRCKHITFYRPMSKGVYPRGVISSPPVRTVDARAAVLVDKVREADGDQVGAAQFTSWTKRLCGLSPRALAHMQENTVGCDCPKEVPKRYRDLKWWSSAVAGKSRHSSHPLNPEARGTYFRELLAMDFLEFKVNGVKFHLLAFVDSYCTFALGTVTQTRASETCARALLDYLNKTEMYVASGRKSSVRLRHDAAREFFAKFFRTVAVYSMVVLFPLVPYEHQMNGLVERFNQTLQRMVTVVMHDSNLPMRYVIYVVEYCIYVYNRVPVEGLGWKTRYELATGSKPDVRYLFRCGCLARVLLPLELRRHKFHTYTEDCVYLGPGPNGHGTRFIRLKNLTVYVRDDCVVYGDVMPFRSVGGKETSVLFS
jgi:hypothetical protein